MSARQRSRKQDTLSCADNFNSDYRASDKTMDIFKTDSEDSLYWLKVAILQAQADIKSNKKEIQELRLQVGMLRHRESKNPSGSKGSSPVPNEQLMP